jgi:hypothetical protein
VKRTWSALRQRVLQRYQSHNREILPSDLRVLYLVGEVDSYDESQLPNQQPSIPLSMTQTSSFFEDSPLLSLDYLKQSPAPSSHYQNRREDRCESPRAGGSRALGLKRRLVMCQIEREKAQTEMLKAKRRLIEAQIRNLEKNGSVDLRFSIDTLDN